MLYIAPSQWKASQKQGQFGICLNEHVTGGIYNLNTILNLHFYFVFNNTIK